MALDGEDCELFGELFGKINETLKEISKTLNHIDKNIKSVLRPSDDE